MTICIGRGGKGSGPLEMTTLTVFLFQLGSWWCFLTDDIPFRYGIVIFFFSYNFNAHPFGIALESFPAVIG